MGRKIVKIQRAMAGGDRIAFLGGLSYFDVDAIEAAFLAAVEDRPIVIDGEASQISLIAPTHDLESRLKGHDVEIWGWRIDSALAEGAPEITTRKGKAKA